MKANIVVLERHIGKNDLCLVGEKECTKGHDTVTLLIPYLGKCMNCQIISDQREKGLTQQLEHRSLPDSQSNYL